MATMGIPQPTGPNPALLGWPGQNINQNPSGSPIPATSPVQAPNIPGGTSNPGNLPNLFTNFKDATRASGGLQALSNAEKVQLFPQLAELMKKYGIDAGSVFGNYANLGSPFYAKKQADVFGQGVQQNQNAAALARQQLNAQGYGATPSGATAATIGGMNVAGGQSLAEQFLEQLFQNEQLQLTGAQGEAGVASLFNPSPFGNIGVPGSNPTQGPSAASQFADIMKGLGIGQGGSSPTYSSSAGFGLG